nr:uncharacterized protein CI109_004733 [Kwoniella shandongensis]KAA5526956.1 hypothetical protein CI109_004733 [Kwoniella shandongensis]
MTNDTAVLAQQLPTEDDPLTPLPPSPTSSEAIMNDIEYDYYSSGLSDIPDNWGEEEAGFIDYDQEEPNVTISRRSARLKLAQNVKPDASASSSKHQINDDDSDYDQPAKKKTKRTARKSKTTSRTKTKQRRTTKKRKNNSATPGTDSEDDEGSASPKKGRKVLLAKAAVWHDIPDWGDRTDCPLLELPREILDMCFGLRTGLGMRDYLALAGVSKFFRHQMTDGVFHEIVHHLDIVYDKPTTNHARHMFSRQVKNWRKEPKRKVVYPSNPNHYIPRGPRTEWSQAQYTVYKEEQGIWKGKIKAEQKKALVAANEKIKEKKKSDKRIEFGGVHRTILAKVRGCLPGEPPAAKTERGLPVEPWSEDGANPASLAKTQDGADGETNALEPETTSIEGTVTPDKNKRLGNGDWTVPDSDPESEEEWSEVELDSMTGRRLVHDYYPSEWRKKGAKLLLDQVINKTDARKDFKITDAELLCLKHVLVPNPMNTKNPQQFFRYTAVEALAYRAHGGVMGHKQHMKEARAKAVRLAQNRQARIDQAIADGTYVKKKRRCQVPPYKWSYREYEHEIYCDSGCECWPEWKNRAW